MSSCLQPSHVEEELEECEDWDDEVDLVTFVTFGGVQELPAHQSGQEESVHCQSNDLGRKRKKIIRCKILTVRGALVTYRIVHYGNQIFYVQYM